jgi:mono/diheme cytochrome c family protein
MRTLTKTVEMAMMAFLLAAVASAAGDAKAGKAVYTQRCANCHGATGAANPKIEQMMHVQIPNLGSPEVQKMSDAELAGIIQNGKGKMPPMHGLSGSSVNDVVAYVRTFKK